VGYLFGTERVGRLGLVAGAVLSVLPDLDVVGFGCGIRYADPLGHRGLSHSLAFAAACAGLAVFVLRATRAHRGSLWLYLFIAMASHGMLDALTNGGLGVAFFAPFSNARYFFPLRPIVVSPISVGRFFSGRGLDVLESEAVWIWLPVALLVTATYAGSGRRRRQASAA